MFNRIRVVNEMHSRILSVVACGLAGFALAGFTLQKPAVAKDLSLNAPVDVETTVGSLREVPAGEPLPGLHLDANIKGHVVDIYVSPMNFASKYVKVVKGEYVHIVGTEVKSGDGDVVLARAISTGSVDKRTGAFREDMTIYLRNDQGPLW